MDRAGDGVITALKAEVVKILAAPLPLTSLADDVVALNRSLHRTEGPIVVAGHAYAGAVIALARRERVKAWFTSPLLPLTRVRRSQTCSIAANLIPWRQNLHRTAMA
jgi:hypothetical protein